MLAVLLFAGTFVAYHPSLHGELLLDDDVHITRAELRPVAGLGRIWTDIGATQQYYPVLHTAFWLEHRIWGDATFGYHLLNVLLHAASALLVAALMRRLKLAGAWIAAFVFALHPVCVESVAWIAEQKNTLSTVFYLSAAWMFLGYIERRNPIRYMFATLLFGGALLSKTATATLPAALLVVFWWQRGKLDVKREVAPLLPWVMAAIAAGAVTVSVERELISGIDARLSLSGIERLIVAGQAWWFYLGKLVWPSNLAFIYERWAIDAANVASVLPLVGVLLLGAGFLWWARQWRGPMATFLYFTGTLLPVAGFVNIEWFVFSFVADHFQYLASLGVIVPGAAGLASFTAKLPVRSRHAALAVAVTIVGALGMLTWHHSGEFRGRVTLYTHTVARAPGSIAARYLLGVALMDDPARAADAVAAFEAALRLNPDAAAVHEKLGVVLLRMPGRTHDAIEHLETALRLKPGSATTRGLLAAAWFDAGRLAAAEPSGIDATIAAYRRAVDLNPNFAEAHFNLGNALLRIPERRLDAVAHFEAAVRLQPDFAAAHANLGAAIVTQPGRLEEAIAHFEAALRVQPDFAPARNNLERARRLRDARRR
jgi:cytochrome c-type biogenesis protein CcmH/NrfG